MSLGFEPPMNLDLDRFSIVNLDDDDLFSNIFLKCPTASNSEYLDIGYSEGIIQYPLYKIRAITQKWTQIDLPLTPSRMQGCIQYILQISFPKDWGRFSKHTRKKEEEGEKERGKEKQEGDGKKDKKRERKKENTVYMFVNIVACLPWWGIYAEEEEAFVSISNHLKEHTIHPWYNVTLSLLYKQV